jgi:hypothetical protein
MGTEGWPTAGQNRLGADVQAIAPRISLTSVPWSVDLPRATKPSGLGKNPRSCCAADTRRKLPVRRGPEVGRVAWTRSSRQNPTFLGHRLGRLRPLPSGTEPLTPEATNRPRSPPGDRSHAKDPPNNLAAAGPASQSLRMRRPGPDRETPRNAKTRFERDRRGGRMARKGKGGCAPRRGSVRGVSSGGRRAAAAQPGAGLPPAAELCVPDTTGAITTSTPRACSAATSSCGAPLSVTTTSIGSRSHR